MKKLSSLLVVLLLMMASFTAGVQYERGDVNQDGQVSIADVTTLVDYLLTGSWGDEPVTPPDGHEWVDLGLPSGTLWATMNVGANSPEECGDYFSWGELETKDYYDWGTYKWCNGTDRSLTKYCTVDTYGTVDNQDYLDPEDDAAYMIWGQDWCIPSRTQVEELINNCTWTWTSINGVNGQLVTGPNGNTMFLPVTGTRYLDSTYTTRWGFYWSRTLATGNPDVVFTLDFSSSGPDLDFVERANGEPIRPVRIRIE